MARATHGKFLWLAYAAIVLSLINGSTARGRKTLTDLDTDGELRRLNKLAIKTIKSVDGDIIDCVDFYKQPAFDHPLLKNHTIQMRPSVCNDHQKKPSSWKLSGQLWHKNESCPEGTIPIQRIQKSHLLRPTFKGFGINANAPPTESVKIDSEDYNLGGEAVINVWNVHVEPGELSIAAIFVGVRDRPDFVASGWMVSKNDFGDDTTRLFGYYAVCVLPPNWFWEWMVFVFGISIIDNGACMNLRCAGFVQTNKDIGFGLALSPVSVYGGDQYTIRIKIYVDPISGNWWLAFNGVLVGYWPSSLFKNMAKNATYIQWGGQVSDTYPRGQHTSTQMGSGHFPDEGYKKAAFFTDVLYYGNALVGDTPPVDEKRIDKSGCYGMSKVRGVRPGPGLVFYYGGPGGPDCDR